MDYIEFLYIQLVLIFILKATIIPIFTHLKYHANNQFISNISYLRCFLCLIAADCRSNAMKVPVENSMNKLFYPWEFSFNLIGCYWSHDLVFPSQQLFALMSFYYLCLDDVRCHLIFSCVFRKVLLHFQVDIIC